MLARAHRGSFALVGLCSLVAFVGTACGSSGSESSSDSPTNSPSDGGADLADGQIATSEGGLTPPGEGEVVDPAKVTTKLPVLPQLSRVTAMIVNRSVEVGFFPVDGAKDYRIYPLPKDEDVTVEAGGGVSVKNAIYRCAGNRQTENAGKEVTSKDTPLGYAYADAGPGRVPVYVLAGPMDEFEGWDESRLKVYTMSTTERDQLIAKQYHDRGIAFYVPEVTGADTKTIYTTHSEEIVAGQGWTKYARAYSDQSTGGAAASFPVLQAAAPGALAIRAVTYQSNATHTELTLGDEQFARAAKQGNSPYWKLHWAGLTGETLLVVEALDNGCPYQGFLSPQSITASPGGGSSAPHQAFLTLDELRAASATGEVFVNGQHDAANRPKAIARSYMKVNVAAPTPMDWSDDFSTAPQFTEVPYSGDFNSVRFQSTNYDLTFNRLDDHYTAGKADRLMYAYGTFLGEFWVAYSDLASDVVGRMRLTVKPKAQIGTGTFLHTTMSVDNVGTGRRYPQMIVSDLEAPIQEAILKSQGRTIIFQTINGPAPRAEIQVFKNFAWDVNNQHQSYVISDPDILNNGRLVAPRPSVFERAAMDKTARYDMFVSTQAAYVFLDGEPLGCARFSPRQAPRLLPRAP